MNQEYKDKILYDLLDEKFFQTYKSKDYSANSWKSFGLELIITPECNQKCDYCYLVKHGDKLYPKEIRDHNTILKNLKLLLDRFEKEHFEVCNIQLFSGEIWASQFAYDILEILYQKSKQYIFTKFFIIPSNMSFLIDDNAIIKIQNYIDKFNALGITLHFSASVDGKILDEKVRQFIDTSKKHTDDFYDRLFKFCKKNNFALHPMISSQSIKYWKDNYLWFQEMFKKYNLHSNDCNNLFMLEVRDDTWNEDAINDYLKYIEFLVDYFFKNFFKQDLKQFTKYIFNLGEFSDITCYNPIRIIKTQFNVGCTMHPNMFIRLGDLSIVPCHRTQYPEFIYGKFKDITKSLDVEANNIDLPIYIHKMMSFYSLPDCYECIYNKFCNKQCLGAQYEYTGDLLKKCESSCSLYKQKFKYLLELYFNMGVINELLILLHDKDEKNIDQLTDEFKRIIKLILPK